MSLKNWQKNRKFSISKAILQSPTRILSIAFLVLIFTGTGLLMLPFSSTGERLGLVDALFTSASASCVTGLSVIDIGTRLSGFGQGILLILIQIGGIGIMTFSTLFLLIAGKRPSIAGQTIIRDTFTHGSDKKIVLIIRDIFLFTLFIEGIGFIFLFFCFLSENGIKRSLYLSIFHSISAFCNAGFSPFSDNLIHFQESWIINLTLCALIICGGLGFLVFSELKTAFPFKNRTLHRLSLHSKLVLISTLSLLIISTFVIAAMEWHNTLAPLTFPGHFLASFFQAVSSRTAGFNTIQIGNMANETLFVLIVLMFIGAGPGSCAGGVKTTTFATMITLGFSRFSGKHRTQAFHRTISRNSIDKAINVILISFFVIFLAVLILLMSEIGEIPHPMSRGKFLELLFEVVSAFGTVGLSTGITPGLSSAGKIMLIIVMFIGRLGPLTIVLALGYQKTSQFYYAEENIMIG